MNKNYKKDQAIFIWKVSMDRKDFEGKETRSRLNGVPVRMDKIRRAIADADETMSICSKHVL